MRKLKNPRGRLPCTPEKASYAHWCHLQGWTMTATAVALKLNVGTISKIINRHRYPDAQPVPLPGMQ